MKPDDKFWLWFFTMLFTFALAGAVFGVISYNRHEQAMIDAGYEKKQVPAGYVMEWVKKEPK
jgi:hypothetical protein